MAPVSIKTPNGFLLTPASEETIAIPLTRAKLEATLRALTDLPILDDDSEAAADILEVAYLDLTGEEFGD